MVENSLKVDTYDYVLPDSLIASYPADPKDSAKLLVYHRQTKTITHTTFKEILDFIPTDTAILLNDTKVVKARIFGNKQSGGKIELLLNSPLENNTFLAYIRGRIKVGSVLYFENELICEVLALNEDGSRKVSFRKHGRELDFTNIVQIFEKIGHVPLPPYIKREDESSDQGDYQTLFAQKYGAVAAPTASLHFTPELYDKMLARHESAMLTLHVGAGTFKPVEVEDIREHVMHHEVYHISKEAEALIKTEKPILAVGTTVTRTVEYYHRTKKKEGSCDLFLHPQNKPQRVNHLLTNFHLPKSTLLMLVASFVGIEECLHLYKEAVEHEYQFFSYGDAMLII